LTNVGFCDKLIYVKNKFSRALEIIKQKTALDIDIYDKNGHIAATTSQNEKNFDFVSFRAQKFANGVYADGKKKLTYFLISTFDGVFLGIIGGADAVSKNYAFMIANIVGGNLTLNDDIKSILLDEYSPQQIRNFAAKHEIVPSHIVFSVCCKENILQKVLEELKKADGGTAVQIGGKIAYIKHGVDPESPNAGREIAQLLYENIKRKFFEEVHIGFGSAVKDFADIGKSFVESAAAVDTALDAGSKNFVYSYKDFLLSKIVCDMQKNAVDAHLSTFLTEEAREIFEDADMMETAEQFLANSLGVSQTSRILYMHRNTLMYRLDKIQRATGLNIRSFDDAVTFQLVKLLYLNSKKR